MALLQSTYLHYTMPLLHSISLHHTSTSQAWVCFCLPWLNFPLLHSTWFSHVSTSLYSSLLHSTMALLESTLPIKAVLHFTWFLLFHGSSSLYTWLKITLPWVYFTVLHSTSLNVVILHSTWLNLTLSKFYFILLDTTLPWLYITLLDCTSLYFNN